MDEMMALRLSAGLMQKVFCTVEENARYADFIARGLPLPENVFQMPNSSYFLLCCRRDCPF